MLCVFWLLSVFGEGEEILVFRHILLVCLRTWPSIANLRVFIRFEVSLRSCLESEFLKKRNGGLAEGSW
jgi:hypothetical protein